MFGGSDGADPHRDRAMERLRRMLHGDGEVESAVKSLRISEGLSQAALAARSGVAQAQISRIESGMIPIPVGDARRLSVALKSDPGDLALAETLSRLSRSAINGTLKAEETLEAIENLMQSSEYSQAGRALADSALSVLLDFAEKAAQQEAVVGQLGASRTATRARARELEGLLSQIEAEGPKPLPEV